MKKRAVLALLALAVGRPAPAAAHDVDVTSIARVFLDEIGDRRYTLSILDTNAPAIPDREGVLPDGCAVLTPEAIGARIVSGFAFECERALTFDDVIRLPWSLAGVVVLARWSDGTGASAFFRGNGRSVPIELRDLQARAGSTGRLARRYFVLGTEHILFGIDHLLFVLGLLLLVRGFVSLVKTITAFTVGHSITLAAAVLGYIPTDRAPVEAAIALSIVLLAREIVAGHRGRVHLVHRYPWVVAFIFGLLHGLGFASALAAIGLRDGDIPLALLSFNLGVEAGQIAFVGILLAFAWVSRRGARPLVPRLKPTFAYALGAVATLWLFDRLPAVFGPG